MRYRLKREDGATVDTVDEPIVADNANDRWLSGRRVWLDPRPSDDSYVETLPSVPAAVTMRQARVALLGAGLLDDVQDAIDAIQDATTKAAAQITWDYSSEVQRHNGFVSMLAPAMGLSEDQLDALFILAEGL